MNKQRKVLITITYNEMGIIIDTKAEEVAQPNLQPTCNQLATDTVSRQDALDAFDGVKVDEEYCTEYDIGYNDGIDFAVSKLSVLPSVQSAEAIPVAFLEEQAKWFESMDNAFAKIEANNIRVMIKKWRGKKDERSD